MGWAGFWASLAVALVLQWLGALTLDKTDAFVTRTLIMIAAQILMYAALFVFVRPLLRQRWMSDRWVVTLLIFCVAGVLRQAIFGVILERLDIAPLQPPAGRFLSAALTVGVAMGFAAVLASLVRELSRRQATLIVEQDRLRHLRTDVTEELMTAHRMLVGEIRTELISTFATLPLSTTDQAPEVLRTAADTVVRPLSHELASRVPLSDPQPALLVPPEVSWRRTLRQAASGFTVHPGLTAITGFLLTLLLSGVYGPGLTLMLSLLNAVGTWIALVGLSAWLRNSRWGRPIATNPLLGVLLVLVAEIPVQILLIASVTGKTPYPTTLASGSLMFWPVIAYTVSLGDGLLREQNRLNDEVLRTTQEVRAEIARTRAMGWAQQRRLARALHGPVQSAVTAAAFRLERSKGTESVERVDAESLRGDILDAIKGMDTDYRSGFLEGFDRIARTWRGACAIRLSCDLPAEELCPSYCTEALLEIVAEACGNAVRHGRATAVDVTVTRSRLLSDCIDLRIVDNGTSRRALASAGTGLGSADLDELTIEWERTISGDACALRAVVPIREVPTTNVAS